MQAQLMLEAEGALDVDLIEEMRLRTWARKNYLPAKDRDETWHPIVLDEMNRIDQENQEAEAAS